MPDHKLPIALLALALTLSVTTLPAVAADAPQVRQAGGISYVSGGVTEEDRDGLKVQAADFNLKLVMATKSGAYLSGTAVLVQDGAGARVLEVKSDGPWFYAKLPAGKYRITATTNGVALRKPVTLAQRTVVVDLRWDD